MPLLALLFKIRSPTIRRCLILAGIAVALKVQYGSTWWLFTETLAGYIQYFLAGVFVVDLYLSGLLRRVPRLAWDIAGTAALLAVFLLPEDKLQPVAPLLIFALAAALHGRSLRWLLSRPWFAAIGGMCYTLYLWHTFVMSLMLKLTLRLLPGQSYLGSMALELAFLLPVLFVVSVGLFLVIEKPCMEPNWPERLRFHLRKHPQPASLDAG